jgi:hypothetical protein
MEELSNRAKNWLSSSYGLHKGMKLASANAFDPLKNRQGCVNLGVAENELMFDLLSEKVS